MSGAEWFVGGRSGAAGSFGSAAEPFRVDQCGGSVVMNCDGFQNRGEFEASTYMIWTGQRQNTAGKIDKWDCYFNSVACAVLQFREVHPIHKTCPQNRGCSVEGEQEWVTAVLNC